MKKQNSSFFNKNFWIYFIFSFIFITSIFLNQYNPKTYQQKSQQKLIHSHKKLSKPTDLLNSEDRHFPNSKYQLNKIHFDTRSAMYNILTSHQYRNMHPIVATFLFVLLPFFIFKSFLPAFFLHLLIYSLALSLCLRVTNLFSNNHLCPLIAGILFLIFIPKTEPLIMADIFFSYCLIAVISILLGMYHKIINPQNKKILVVLGLFLFGVFAARCSSYMILLPTFISLFFLLPKKKYFWIFTLSIISICSFSYASIVILAPVKKTYTTNRVVLKDYNHLSFKIYQDHPDFFSQERQKKLKKQAKKDSDLLTDMSPTPTQYKNTPSLYLGVINLWIHFPIISLKDNLKRSKVLWSPYIKKIIIAKPFPPKIRKKTFNIIGIYFWSLLLFGFILTILRKKEPLFIFLFLLPYTLPMFLFIPAVLVRYFYYIQFLGPFLLFYFLFLFQEHKKNLKVRKNV